MKNTATSDSQNRLATLGIAAFLLCCFAFLCIHSMLRHSATFDEHVYATAGYSYFETGMFRMKRDAPPLIPTVSCFALKTFEFFSHRLTSSQFNPNWIKLDEYELAKDFFTRDNAGGIAMLQWARIPIVLLGLLLGIHVFLWTRLLFGDYGGLLALLVFCFDPNMIAHSTIISADLGLAGFFLATHYFLYRAVSEKTWWAIVPLSCFAALTVAVKFTGLIVFPSMLILTLVLFAFPPKEFLASLKLTVAKYRGQLMRKALVAASGSLLATLILISLLYHGTAGVFSYIEGAKLIYRNVTPGFAYYFFGEFRQQSWPQYYLVASLIKSPPGTLLLFALAMIPWRGSNGSWQKLAFLLLPFALVHLVSAGDQANFGLRRVLLAFPFMFVLIGRLQKVCLPTDAGAGWKKWTMPALLALLAISVPISALAIHPHELSYFNFFIGGPKNGHRYLVDSNIDWGQDLPALADYVRRNNVREVVTEYFGTDDPRLYGIPWRPITDAEYLHPKPTVYAISLQNLIYRRLHARAYGDTTTIWLDRFKPTATAAYSIYIYDFRNGVPPYKELPNSNPTHPPQPL